MSKPSWTTHVPQGVDSSRWKTTTMKVGFHKNCTLCRFCIMHYHYQLCSNTLPSKTQLELCHWPITSGLFWWHVSIGSTTKKPCGGLCLLVEERLAAVSLLCRQGIGSVLYFVNARAREEECCQISLTEHVPMGLSVT